MLTKKASTPPQKINSLKLGLKQREILILGWVGKTQNLKNILTLSRSNRILYIESHM